MADRTVIPELDLARIRRYVDARVPAHAAAHVRMEMEVRGTSVTIVERRSPWRAGVGPEWSRFPIAKLRYDPEAAQWSLHWRDGHEHWHAYDGVEPVAYVEPLLAEMNADPRGIFWG